MGTMVYVLIMGNAGFIPSTVVLAKVVFSAVRYTRKCSATDKLLQLSSRSFVQTQSVSVNALATFQTPTWRFMGRYK